jgi:hypothetical protein
MDKELKDLINLLIERNSGVMLLLTYTSTYLLADHHKHLDPEDAPKILLGKHINPGSRHVRNSNRILGAKLLYLTEPWK